jgi:hypothetical protein
LKRKKKAANPEHQEYYDHYKDFDMEESLENQAGWVMHLYLNCGHQFHRICLKNYRKHYETRRCPVCKKMVFKETYDREEAIEMLLDWRVTLIQKMVKRYQQKE